MQITKVAVIFVLSALAFAAEKTVSVTVVSSESVKQYTGYEGTTAGANCVGQNCQGSASTFHTKIPVRFLYVVMDGQHIRLQAKQKFMTSYGKTLPPGDYTGAWKNSHTLVINYTENGKDKTADYEMAGVW